MPNSNFKTAREAKEIISEHQDDSILIVSHMDADGISSAAIMSKALNRLNIDHRVKFVRMLYREIIDELELEKLTIFTDLGSSQLRNLRNKYKENDVIIADHHSPQEAEGWSHLTHFNAHQEGLDGVEEISGAGMSYLIAKELDPKNKDLSTLALVGAIGDVQNAWGELKGYNREIAQEGVNAGVIKQEKDLLLYGRHTRPLFKALKNLTDPPIPGVSNSVEGCVSMLKDLEIPYKTKKGYRRPVDLSNEEKQKLASELITRAITHVPDELTEYVPGLIIGEVHTLLNEEKNSMLRGADVFSTCINSTARHEQPLIGYEVAMGDRDVYYRSMLNLLKYHRRCIAEGMTYIEQNGLEEGKEGYVQYFDASDVLKETFVGTIASLTIGHEKSDPYKPILGIVKNNGSAKVSARCSKLLFLKGLDMAKAIREAAETVGGEGGGHAVACGARIGKEKIPEFIDEFESLLINES
ncbi:MAG: DHH family phosphoesterase [Hadesarchaea archaeon]|nr:DHH family phosphoesterase [Hadesarchaea archaeon]